MINGFRYRSWLKLLQWRYSTKQYISWLLFVFISPSWWRSTEQLISMTQCKTAVTPLLMHWSYCSLVLSHRYSPTVCPALPRLHQWYAQRFILCMYTSYCCMVKPSRVYRCQFQLVLPRRYILIDDNVLVQSSVNTLRTGDAYVCQWTGSSLL